MAFLLLMLALEGFPAHHPSAPASTSLLHSTANNPNDFPSLGPDDETMKHKTRRVLLHQRLTNWTSVLM